MLTLNAGSTRASSRIRTTWNFFLWGEMLPLRLGFLVVSFALKWSTGQVLLLNWSTKSLFWHKMVCWVPLQNAAAECRCRLQTAVFAVELGCWRRSCAVLVKTLLLARVRAWGQNKILFAFIVCNLQCLSQSKKNKR